jgi:hypothetical protein
MPLALSLTIPGTNHRMLWQVDRWSHQLLYSRNLAYLLLAHDKTFQAWGRRGHTEDNEPELRASLYVWVFNHQVNLRAKIDRHDRSEISRGNIPRNIHIVFLMGSRRTLFQSSAQTLLPRVMVVMMMMMNLNTVPKYL